LIGSADWMVWEWNRFEQSTGMRPISGGLKSDFRAGLQADHCEMG
jgi:hypothetical protein